MRRAILPLGAFYLACAVLFTWPLAADPGGAFPSAGPATDAPAAVWNIWHFHRAVTHGADPFHTSLLFAPLGAGLVMHTYTPLLGVLDLPVGNPMLTLNLAMLLSFVLSALGAFALCRRIVGATGPSMLAGFIFAFAPYKLAHLPVHPNLMLSAAVPWFALLVWDVRRGMPRRRLAAAAALLAVTIASDYYYAWFCFVLLAVLLAEPWIVRAMRWMSGRRMRLAATIIAIPILSRGAMLVAEASGLENRDALRYTADALAWIAPSGRHWLFGGPALEAFHAAVLPGGTEENTIYLGWSAILAALASVPVLRGRRDPAMRRALIALGAFAAMAMPMVALEGRRLFYLPTVLVHYVPFVNNFRCPSRAAMMVMLFLPIPVATLLREGMDRIRRRDLRVVVAGLAFVLVGAEYLERPMPMMRARDVPEVFRQLAAGSGAILEIPVGVRDGFRSIGCERSVQMYYQTITRRPMAGGFLARVPDTVFRWMRTAPILSSIVALEEDSTRVVPPAGSDDARRYCAETGTTTLVIDPAWRNSPAARYARAAFAEMGRARVVGGVWEVWDLSP